MANQAAVLSILIRANTSQASSALLKFNQGLTATEKHASRTTSVIEKGANKAADALESLAKVVAIGGGLTVAAGFAYSVKKAADFEQQLSSLGAVADASAKQMDRLRKQAIRAGADTKFSAMEAAQAQTELAKGGLKTSQILKGGLKSALALAAAGEMELADAAETTVNAMKLFGLRGKDAMKIADGLATAANRTTADVSDFALAFKMGGSAAKASGMSFKETTAALEALASVGIRGSDAGTSLKAMLVQLASPTEKQQKLMKKLNLDFFDSEGKMKSLTSVSGMLRDRLKDLTKEQQLHAVKTLAGTDGMRAMLSLFDAGPQKIAKFQRELSKQGTAAEVAKKKQDNLKGAVEQLGGSLETLAIQIGTAALPTLRELTEDVDKFVDKVSKIVARDDLDLGEKLDQIFEVAKVDAQPWIDKLKAAVEKADIPKKIGDLISAATPIIAAAAAKAAGTAAVSFARAFAEADIWGKLVIGGWLLRKMGGPGAFKKLGVLAGAEMGKGMAAGAAATSAAGGAAGAAGGSVVKNTAATAGAAAAGSASGSFAKAAAGAAAGAGAAVQSKAAAAASAAKAIAPAFLALKVATDFMKDKSDLGLLDQYADTIERVSKSGDAAGMRKLADQMRATAQANNDLTRGKHLHLFADALDATAANGGHDLRQLQDAFRVMAKSSGGDLERLRDEFTKTGGKLNQLERDHGEVVDNIRSNWSRLRGSTGVTLKDVREQVRSSTKMIKARLGTDTAEGKDALVRNFKLARQAIRTTMRDSKGITAEGLSEIRRLMAKELRDVYGISPGAALSIAKHGDIKGKAGLTPGPAGRQRGGAIFGGKPTGDSIPAMLERGEYVINRKAVDKVGRRNLDRLNFGMAPRFQGGGIVGLGRELQREGYQVGEHPAFGGVHPVHTGTSYHYKGMALDVNADGWPGGEAAALDKLYSRLKGMSGIVELLWRVAGHFDHLHVAMSGAGGPLGNLGGMDAPKLARLLVDGPQSGIKGIVQGALDLTRGAAQKQLDAVAASSGGPGGGTYSNWSGSWVDLMGTISKERGWNLADWKRLVDKESGGDPNARNQSSGAYGLGQFLGSTLEAYRKYGAGSSDPVDQIRAMAQYISDRYGNPSAALAFHNANNWYAAGGSVGKAGGTRSGLGALGAKGNLTQRLTRAMARGTGVKELLKKVRGIGLPARLEKDLARLASDADVFGDRASRAESLGQPVNGKSQAEWLNDQLAALFAWRNRIIEAEQVVVARRQQIADMIVRARARLDAVGGAIAAASAERGLLAGKLEEAQKHPKRNKDLIKTLKGRIGKIDAAQKQRGKVQSATKRALGGNNSGLIGQRAKLNTARGDLLSSLDEVQGAGSPTGILKTLPAVGVLGGRIFDVQMALRTLGSEQAVTDDSARTGALEQLLRESNLRFAVSQAQYKVFQDAPKFHTGGIVPGVTGQEVPAVVKAGEGVFTREQMAAMGAGGQVVVIVQDGAVDKSKIRVIAGEEAQRVTRTQARNSARGLPGRGGGI